jgi:hypothetical protein
MAKKKRKIKPPKAANDNYNFGPGLVVIPKTKGVGWIVFPKKRKKPFWKFW